MGTRLTTVYTEYWRIEVMKYSIRKLVRVANSVASNFNYLDDSTDHVR